MEINLIGVWPNGKALASGVRNSRFKSGYPDTKKYSTLVGYFVTGLKSLRIIVYFTACANLAWPGLGSSKTPLLLKVLRHLVQILYFLPAIVLCCKLICCQRFVAIFDFDRVTVLRGPRPQ